MSNPLQPLEQNFYANDPVDVARGLIGATLTHNHSEYGTMKAMIVETEAYRGEEDQACHARAGRTPRTEALYGPPGRSYVYLIYGMYDLFNVVAWPEGKPAGVLVRAVEPLLGITGKTHGPGRLTRAMHITRQHHNIPMWQDELTICKGESFADDKIESGPRIGVDYAGEWAKKPWRFWLRDNPYVSVVPKRKNR